MFSAIPAYAELHCISNFSFLRGASHPEELVARAHALDYAALALTDECSLAGVVRAHMEAKRLGLHLLIGTELRLADDGPHLVLLAQTRTGYGNLSELITLGRTRAVKGSYRLTQADLDGRTPEAAHLCALPDCLALLVPGHNAPLAATLAHAHWVRALFGDRAWIAVELLHRLDDHEHFFMTQAVAEQTGLPLVAAGNVHMHLRSRKPLQDTLTAVRLGRPVSECGFGLMPNAEAHLRARLRLANVYPPELLAQTLAVAARCNFSLDELRYEYPEEIVPLRADGTRETPASYLRRLTEEGVARRFEQGVPPRVRAQIEHELALIAELHYEAYFLTVHDLVAFARAQGILCQGRGSAANSAVCYCLGITEVDPARGNLLFERFISRERNEPPDIDVDFEHERREEVIQYLYAKYGRDRAALTAVVISYRPRSALRDVGKALGFDLQCVDQIAKSRQWWDGRRINEQIFIENGLDPQSLVVRHWIELVNTLVGFPRHLSQHVGGFVIARDRLSRLVPIENAAMAARSVIEWDKDDLDALGLLKVDVLALGMLSAIRGALAFLSQRHGRTFRMQDIPPKDAPTYDMICAADTVGVFQIESRAQMSMLPRLRPRTFYDLVIEVAIVRPGPIQGGMVHPYLKRRSGEEPVSYPSPEVARALERTLGVPIFQEQVMQIAILAADFTPGEADALRRAMAAWKRKGGLGPFYDRLVGRLLAKGYTPEFAESIFKQIQGFGEYGFPESHAASFALLVYVSSWLKRHHPDAYLAAMLNAQPLGFYSPSQLVQDARRHGVVVRPVDVTASDWLSTLEPCAQPPDQPGDDPTTWGRSGYAVRLGLHMVKGLRAEAAQRLMAERRQAPFADVEDLARRCEFDRHTLDALAGANALAGLAGHRRQARWEVAALRDAAMRHTPVLKPARFNEAPLVLPAAREGDEIAADYASIGLTLGRHPVALLRPKLAKLRLSPAAELMHYPAGRIARACGLVTVRQRPDTAKGVIFVTLEDETGQVNLIVWPKIIERYRKELLGASLLAAYGQWQRDASGRVTHLIAGRLVDHSAMLGELVAPSRDFH